MDEKLWCEFLEIEQNVVEFLENRKFAKYIHYLNSLFSLIHAAPPGIFGCNCSEWFGFRKFNNFWIFWELSHEMFVSLELLVELSYSKTPMFQNGVAGQCCFEISKGFVSISFSSLMMKNFRS